jgi:hypothetical protein
MNKRELTTELKRRIKFLKVLIHDAKLEKTPAMAGKLWAYTNVLRLIQQSSMR